jgi:hypothetical protein
VYGIARIPSSTAIIVLRWNPIPDELQDEAVILRLPAPSVQVLDQVLEAEDRFAGIPLELPAER